MILFFTSRLKAQQYNNHDSGNKQGEGIGDKEYCT
jgi:hypothetical protein